MSLSVHDNCRGNAHFKSTRWSVVLNAADSESGESRAAITTLCEMYWYPLYVFVRGKGYDAETAQDLTQGFFARLLEKRDFRTADPERGRFRTFLLAALQNYLRKSWPSLEPQLRRPLTLGRGLKLLDTGRLRSSIVARSHRGVD